MTDCNLNRHYMCSLDQLRASADPSASLSRQLGWLKQLKTAVKTTKGLRPVRVAIMGNGTLNLLADVITLWLGFEGFAPEIYLCAYNSWPQEIFDSNSAFYAFEPDIVWLLAGERDLNFRQVTNGADASVCEDAITSVAEEWRSCWRQIRRQRPVRIIQSNVEEPHLRTFGHYEASVPWSRSSLIVMLNRTVSDFAHRESVTLFDMNFVASCFGLGRWRQERQWFQSKQPFAPDAFGLVAFHLSRLVGALLGNTRKCIVLDLDNTLWGGVIGDDGVEGIKLDNGAEGEAFVAFQEYLKKMLERGILLAVCSKNERDIAEEPFRTHPAMRLRLEDISCFCANWENKADNLRQIASSLNIGLDSLVFVDDNHGERELVRQLLPEVSVVALPEDPSNYPAALAAGCYFEPITYSVEDAARTQLYRENAQREAGIKTAADLQTYLRDLEMVAESGPVDSFHLPRMAQLLAKTNQFHLTTTRYGEAEIAALAETQGAWVRWFSLRDRIGDHGLISVVILRPEDDSLAIDTWAMSCRVFSRGMEEFIFKEILETARVAGARRLIGRYRPTAKNHPVANLYDRLGFLFDAGNESESQWVLSLDDFSAQFSLWIARPASEPEELAARR